MPCPVWIPLASSSMIPHIPEVRLACLQKNCFLKREGCFGRHSTIYLSMFCFPFYMSNFGELRRPFSSFLTSGRLTYCDNFILLHKIICLVSLDLSSRTGWCSPEYFIGYHPFDHSAGVVRSLGNHYAYIASSKFQQRSCYHPRRAWMNDNYQCAKVVFCQSEYWKLPSIYENGTLAIAVSTGPR